jgi:hypothetical protein
MRRRELHALFVKKFGRRDVTFFNLGNICKQLGILTGRNRPKVQIDSERLSKDGFVEVKVRDERGSRGQNNFVLKHCWLWEKQNGPVPQGHRLKCIDGNRRNTDPSNWECIPNGLLGRLHKRAYEAAPVDLKPTIMAVAKLDHAIASRKTKD